MTSPEEIEYFLSNFTREYIRVFNMLERNISYSLRYMGNEGESSANIEKIKALSFCKKIKKLKGVISDKELNSDFKPWLETLEECRLMRNNLVHGHWEVAWWLDKPIRFDACELIGNVSKSIRGDFSIEELAVKLKNLKQIGNDFSELRKKYEKLKFTQHL